MIEEPMKRPVGTIIVFAVMGLVIVGGLVILGYYFLQGRKDPLGIFGKSGTDEFAWKEYTAPDRTFSILFPGEAEEWVDSTETELGYIYVKEYMVQLDSVRFEVSRHFFPIMAMIDWNDDELLQMLGSWRDGIFEDGWESIYEDTIKVAKYPGIEIKVKKDFPEGDSLLVFTARGFFAGSSMYDVKVVGVDKEVPEYSVNKYLNSFRLKE
ncbi:hypothetical protein JXM67_01440 [candidate division WOR-3 bacterium]|nr:hypothetical protein [candidate division WOR-3 bacterium]